jgi:hypothetical protein
MLLRMKNAYIGSVLSGLAVFPQYQWGLGAYTDPFTYQDYIGQDYIVPLHTKLEHYNAYKQRYSCHN